MPDTHDIVINTGPIIAIVAALGDLEVLRKYKRVCVPYEVSNEILVGGPSNFAVAEFEAADWLEKRDQPLTISPVLLNSLDVGEASVIQLALTENIRTASLLEVGSGFHSEFTEALAKPLNLTGKATSAEAVSVGQIRIFRGFARASTVCGFWCM